MNSDVDVLAHSILAALNAVNGKACFLEEILTRIGRNYSDPEIKSAINELESRGRVLVRDHFCADPHLPINNLKTISAIETLRGPHSRDRVNDADGVSEAVRRSDEVWNAWVDEFLINHECE